MRLPTSKRKPPQHGFIRGADLRCYYDNPACSLLTPAEEAKLTDRCSYGDMEAVDEPCLHNMRLVISIASRYTAYCKIMPLEDAVQAGYFGCRHAALKFDPGRGVRFCTFATWWIKQAIQREQINYQIIHVPCGYLKKSTHKKPPKHVLQALNARRICLFGQIEDSGSYGSGRGQAVDKFISHHATRNGTVDFVEPDDTPEEHKPGWLMRALNDREKLVIKRRFGIKSQEKNLREIGEELGIGKERVRQIETRAIKRMREQLAAHT